jgi:DNA-binding transcriptional ArsR family regulator
MKTLNFHSATDTSDEQAARADLIAPAVAQRLAGVFKSLSDPTRLRIISLLAEREFCVGGLAAALEMEQSTISHQLRDMRAQRLVSFRREGRRVFYRLDDPHVRSLFEQGLAHSQDQ